jgi:colanic acid biosynthesis glycosyl transferase WcaI
MIGDGEGEIARLVQRHLCGITIAPGNAATLAETLRRWSEAPEALAEMGASARQMLDERFTRRALEQWTRLLEQLR